MDLGMEGARFSSLKQVSPGEQVLVCLQLPNARIECKGKVCWSEDDEGGGVRFGVRFLDLRETERDSLGRYLITMTPVSV